MHYYTQVAPVLLPLVAGRPVTRKRWPDGVQGQPFFEKNAPTGTPAWVRTVRLPVPGSTKDRETIDFTLIDDLAGLVWTANLAALEIHVPQWTVGPRGAVHGPDRLVVDLDPGAPAGLAECAELAFAVRERLAATADVLPGDERRQGHAALRADLGAAGRDGGARYAKRDRRGVRAGDAGWSSAA